MANIFAEVQVVFGKSPAHIVIQLRRAALHKLLKFRDNRVVAAGSVHTDAQSVIDGFSAVEREDAVRHLAIDEIRVFAVQQQPVRRDGEPEFFMVLLFQASGVGDRPLDHVEIHQRFPAEKIQFQIVPPPGTADQKIDRALRYLRRHQHPSAAEIPLRGEAIAAAQVTVVGDVEAHGFDRGVFQHGSEFFIIVGGKELSFPVQLPDLPVGFPQNGFAVAALQSREHLSGRLVRHAVVQIVEHFKRRVVKDMDRAAVRIQNQMVAVEGIWMYHKFFSE